MQTAQHQMFSGTSGLLLPIPKRDFPPAYQESSRLEYYATLFNSLEINSSFYKLPMPATVAKWAGSVPQHFRFTFKLWRGITHNKGLIFTDGDVFRFMELLSNAADRKGALLVQFPPGVTFDRYAQLKHLLPLLTDANKTQQWDIAVEFRHRSWYRDEVYELLSVFNAGMVLQDMPASASPHIITAENFVYLRFHGPSGNYKGSYSDDVLHEHALYIREWQEDGKTVYVYFNNTAGDALNNLATLQRYVRENG